MKLSKTYEAALEAHNVAIRAFTVAQQAYRTRQIGDVEFLAARREMVAASKLFDIAYAEEAARNESEQVSRTA